MATFFSTRVDAADFEPFPLDPGDILEGEPNSVVHWLRNDGESGLATGIFRSEPAKARYAWSQDETIHVLEGEVRIEFEDGEVLELKRGDVASFRKGDRAVWHIKSPFKEFFVLSP
jgi:uncharacterized cupin superfamily protein